MFLIYRVCFACSVEAVDSAIKLIQKFFEAEGITIDIETLPAPQLPEVSNEEKVEVTEFETQMTNSDAAKLRVRNV